MTREGQKDLLGMWLSENEGAKFWLNVLTELQNRGVKDILIACVDGLKSFPQAINTVLPPYSHSTLYRPHGHGAQFGEIRSVEGLKGGYG